MTMFATLLNQHPKLEKNQKWYIWFSCGITGQNLFFTPRFMMDKSTKLLLSTSAKCINPFHPFSSPATVSSVAFDFRWVENRSGNFLQVKRGPHPPGSIYLPGARKLARIHLVARAISNEKLWGINSSHL